MSDIIAPIVADTDELSSTGPLIPQPQVVPQPKDAPLKFPPEGGIELQDRDRNGGAVRKTKSETSSKPSLSSRLDNLKISTIRQHYYPEGGWGWVVCACAFVINVLTTGLLLSYGILYREVVGEFGDEYADQAMWLGSVSLSLGLFVSPLVVAICRRKSTRLTAVFGGLTAALGCLFTSFASQMHQVFLSYGLVMSVGLSLARVTSSLMIGQYFKRRRERVEVVVTAGTGCGIVLFSYTFANIIRLLGWRLGLHAVTGLAVIPFFVGVCYRSASLYHPQRRAILHLKNQRKKIKDKSGISDKPPFFDFTPLRNGPVLVAMAGAGVCAAGMYAPFFHMVPLVTSLGFEEDSILLLQFHLGAAFSTGCLVFGFLLVKKTTECIVGRQYLCQAAMVAMGLAFLSIHAAEGYYGFVLFAWMFGVPCGGLHYSLKMLVFEKIRAKSFSRAWAYVEWAQSVPALIGIPVTGYISGGGSGRSGFYFSAACSFAGAATLLLSHLTARRPFGWKRGQGSCSTCASSSQPPSCCCTHDFTLQSTSSGHPKCQKTISFSDTVDVADDDSPRRYPYTGKRYEGQNDFLQHQQQHPVDNNEEEWNHDEEDEGNVDFDIVDGDVEICYDEICRKDTVAVVEEQRRTVVNRYGCGHLEEEGGDMLQLPVPAKRQMAVIEEVTSSV